MRVLAIIWHASLTSSGSLHSQAHAAKHHPLRIQHPTFPTVQWELPDLPKKHESRCESTGDRWWWWWWWWRRREKQHVHVQIWYTSESGRLVLASFNMGGAGEKVPQALGRGRLPLPPTYTPEIKQMYKVFDTITWQEIHFRHRKVKPYNTWIPLEQKNTIQVKPLKRKTKKRKKKKSNYVIKITWNFCILDLDYAAYKKSTFNGYINYGTKL